MNTTKLTEGVEELYLGQSYDVSWTSTLECPSEEEYLAMVDSSESMSFLSPFSRQVILHHINARGARNIGTFQNVGGHARCRVILCP